MSVLFLLLTALTILSLGVIVTELLSISIPRYAKPFYVLVLGTIIFSILLYISCTLFSVVIGTVVTHLVSAVIIGIYARQNKEIFRFIKIKYAKLWVVDLLKHKAFTIILIILTLILIELFHTHILLNIKGDLYTGESTYGDLPFHMSNITQIAYSQHFPPDNTFFAGIKLVYPYLINLFSAILVLEGLPIREAIIIPGILLSMGLIVIMHDLVMYIVKDKAIAALTILLYFFNGTIGWYYFLKDNAFNLQQIWFALSNPNSMKEYSHMWDNNIQWLNFTSRMMVPERSLLLGVPAGLIILRIMFFRDHNSKFTKAQIMIVSVLVGFMPLLHTHTALVLALLLPILCLINLTRHNWKNLFKAYLIMGALSVLFFIPIMPLFTGHLGESTNFFRMKLWWMKGGDESLIWFWFKNSYIYIPLSILALLIPGAVNDTVRRLQFCAFVLFAIVNLVLFSPFDWDNVKFFFWIGLFFDLAAASLFMLLLRNNTFFGRTIVYCVIFSLIATGMLSMWREMHVKWVLYSKESVKTAEEIRAKTPRNSTFLTYKAHNSPANNLAGRPILMGYPGTLWVHGIKYSDREQEIEKIFNGASEADSILKKYNVKYIMLEPGTPEGSYLNREYFEKFPVIIKTNEYSVHQVQ
jgi:hypothetical protein